MNKAAKAPIDLRISRYLEEHFDNTEIDTNGTCIVSEEPDFVDYLYQDGKGNIVISQYFAHDGLDTPEQIIAVMKRAIVFRGAIKRLGFSVETGQEAAALNVRGAKEVLFKDLEVMVESIRTAWNRVAGEAKEQCLCMEKPQDQDSH